MAIERAYNVPLRREFLRAPRYKRAKTAINALKRFLQKHMKSEDVYIGKRLNEKIWERGIKNPPHHVNITVVKEDDGKVYAELAGFKYEKPLTEEELKKLEKEKKKDGKKEEKAEAKESAEEKKEAKKPEKPKEVIKSEEKLEKEFKKLEEKTEKIKEEKAKKGEEKEKKLEQLSRQIKQKPEKETVKEPKEKKQAERPANA